ncbi:LysR family transcriptional regulator [Streptomyces sp. NPDC014734]|uniref:helix-turn-helix domain-containing protein n=1 Tax=Streptomyces sp. NPDC014734 TaxID=3364886 RepID=UPI0036FA4039
MREEDRAAVEDVESGELPGPRAEAVAVVAEEGDAGAEGHRTAERLRLSGGRISQTVAKPERRTGSPLFERNSRQVRPTEIGRRPYDDVAPLHRAIRAAFARAASAEHAARDALRVGFPIPDGAPAEFAPVWSAARENEQIRAFAAAALSLPGR